MPLPFADAFFDRILVVHGLEGADATRPLLRQLWRVLAPEGRLLLIRAQSHQPVGAARTLALCARPSLQPWRTRSPASGALFEPLCWDRALYLPPLRGRSLVRSGNTGSGILRRTMPGLFRRAIWSKRENRSTAQRRFPSAGQTSVLRKPRRRPR